MGHTPLRLFRFRFWISISNSILIYKDSDTACRKFISDFRFSVLTQSLFCKICCQVKILDTSRNVLRYPIRRFISFMVKISTKIFKGLIWTFKQTTMASMWVWFAPSEIRYPIGQLDCMQLILIYKDSVCLSCGKLNDSEQIVKSSEVVS